MCVRYGAVTLMREGETRARRSRRPRAAAHGADVILSKGCAEPTARAIIQTPCSGVHLHNFMALHGRFSCARAAASSRCRARNYRWTCCVVSYLRSEEGGERVKRSGRGNRGTRS